MGCKRLLVLKSVDAVGHRIDGLQRQSGRSASGTL